METVIRRATAADIALILKFIRALAEFERAGGAVMATEEGLGANFQDEWRLVRLEGEALSRLAGGANGLAKDESAVARPSRSVL